MLKWVGGILILSLIWATMTSCSAKVVETIVEEVIEEVIEEIAEEIAD